MEKLTESEELVMRCVWKWTGDMPLSELGPMLEEKFQKVWKRTTIRTFLTHMEGKGYVSFYQVGRNSYIKQTIKEDEYRLKKTLQMLDDWYDGTAAELFAFLQKKRKLNADAKNKIVEICK